MVRRFEEGESVEYRDCEEALQRRIDYRFSRPALLRESLTHKSFSNEHPDEPAPHNERLEFLGDAVLDLVVSRRIFNDFPTLPEGELTRIRAEVVSEKGLAAVARDLELGSCLMLGRGEERSGGRDKESLVADALEALLGAIFCDGGFDRAGSVIEALFASAVASSASRKTGIDHKTRLQELLQARHGQPPTYVLTRTEGPDHQRLYTVEVCLADRPIGVGQGRNKKAAEQAAASEALARMGV
jgi:ribonuclease-3